MRRIARPDHKMIDIAEPAEESNVIDLMEALKKSLKNKGKAAHKPANTNAKRRKAR